MNWDEAIQELDGRRKKASATKAEFENSSPS